mmetsp:Transcript_13017/g.38754  ORF Transcript_13017/g.38754 Transcript_13017/m.38754 type:complete len:238 (+) Transcript_13017:1612-2325(+)
MRNFLRLLTLTGAMAALMRDGDLSGDGGVLKVLLRGGKGGAPAAGQVATLKVEGSLADGRVFDDDTQDLVCGAVGNVRALDLAARTMGVGEKCKIEARFDYAYGEAGRPGDVPVPPRATVRFTLELLEVKDAPLHQEVPLLTAEAAANPGQAVRSVTVDGVPVTLDHLGPMVVNKDGSLSRITNWPEMAEVERQRTLRMVVKRNKKRLEDLAAKGDPPVAGYQREPMLTRDQMRGEF